MKRTIIYSILAIASMLATACEDGRGLREEYQPGEGISLTVRTSGTGVQVKSNNADGENENLLNSYYYFFYPKNVTNQAPAVSGYVSGISKTDEHSTTIPVSSNTINNVLFAMENDCRLFVVANPPANLVEGLKGRPTLEDLREMMVVSALETVPQDNFVMVYDGPVNVSSRTQDTAVEATATLSRLACKFTVGAYVTQEIITAGKTYTPVTTEGGLTVTFYNGLNKTTLGGYDESSVSASDYFNSAEIGLEHRTDLVTLEEDDGEGHTVTKDYHSYKSTSPIYTYPMQWEFASAHEPYLLYALTWKISEEGSSDAYRTLYYKLALGRRELLGNDWYDITAKLTVLGNLYPEDPSVIFPYMNYQVAGWNNAFISGEAPNTPAIIKDTRYISVPQSVWKLNNKDSVEIPFSSSHECDYTGFTAIKKDFSSGAPSDKDISADVHITVGEDKVTVTHELNNKLGEGMDISPVEIKFTLKHKDDDNFNQEITITQYPAIFVSTEVNSSGDFYGERNPDPNKGYAYVNGSNAGNSSGTYKWLNLLGANTTGNNSSHYFTVITVTQFDPSTGYVVGDPRDSEINNLGSSRADPWTGSGITVPKKAKADYDNPSGGRTIKYYYPTIDDGSRDNFVAPSFRVCSAHIRSGQNDTYADIQKRCASYQEDGYPAGRWRIPTLAECKLIQVLSGSGMVPNIFIQNGSSYYFAAGWYFTINSSGEGNYRHNTSQSAATRCVYDEWYWSMVDDDLGKDNSDKSFRWGDVPRNYKD